jgi:hypothetical protein
VLRFAAIKEDDMAKSKDKGQKNIKKPKKDKAKK